MIGEKNEAWQQRRGLEKSLKNVLEIRKKIQRNQAWGKFQVICRLLRQDDQKKKKKNKEKNTNTSNWTPETFFNI